jgi:putative membrane protein
MKVPNSGRMNERVALSVIGIVSAAVVVAVAVLLLGRGPQAAVPLDVSALPALNAALNGTSGVLLVAGYVCIRRRRRTAHVTCMLTAFAVSTLFLISYVVYHYSAGSRPFTGQGWIRPVYFGLLLSHIGLAVTIVPLALITIYRGLSSQFSRHRRLARWTLPIWLYVSLTGVVVYWMLYHLGP